MTDHSTVPARTSDTDLRRLTDLWRSLGIRWSDLTADAEHERQAHQLPAALEIGAVLGGPGITRYFFDAAGKFVGYGYMAADECDYFVERGREDDSPVRYDIDRDVHEVRLEGRYTGIPKVHEISDRQGHMVNFFELPEFLDEYELSAAPGEVEDVGVGDLLRITCNGRTADYEITRAEVLCDVPADATVVIDARRRQYLRRDDGTDPGTRETDAVPTDGSPTTEQRGDTR